MRGEHGVQQGIARYMEAALPPECWFTAIDHAHAKDALTGALRKARGAKRGLPDFMLVWRGQFFGLEVKMATGRLSLAQRATGNAIKRAGGEYFVVRTSDQVEAVLRDIGIPLRATHLPIDGGRAKRAPARGAMG